MKPFIMVSPEGFAVSFVLPDQVAAAGVTGQSLTINLKSGGVIEQVYVAEYAAKYALSVLLRLVQGEGADPIKVNEKGQPLLYEATCQGDSRCGWSQEVNHRISAPEKCPECGGSVGVYNLDGSPLLPDEGRDKTIKCMVCTETFSIAQGSEIPASCPACGQGPVQLIDDTPPSNRSE